MRHRWLRSLALSLGALAMGPCAFLEAQAPAPLIEPYPPVAAPATPHPQTAPGNETRRAEDADSAPAVSLDRPIPLHEELPVVDQKIQPTGLFANRGEDSFAFGPAGSMPVARPLPAGPASNSTPLPMPTPVLNAAPPPEVPYTWRQPTGSSPTSQVPSLSPIAPIPGVSPGTSFGIDPALPGGTIVSPGPLTAPGGTIVSPGPIAAPGGTIVSPGPIAAPGGITGPMGAPLVDGGCGGQDCCTPGCCTPGCCTPGCCDGCQGCWNGCCNGCCFGDRWFGSAEYLLWFIRGQTLPPLLTTGPANAPVPGALGAPGTSVLFGGRTLDNNPYSGVRLRGGYWFDDCHEWGVDVGGFFLGGNNNTFSTSSLGVPILSRPFVTAIPFNGVPAGGQSIEAVAAPGIAGTFNAVSTFFMYGAEANLRRNLCCGCNWFIDGFVGWRLLGLNESLSMTEKLAVVSSTNPTLPAGTTFLVNDRFGTSNLFNGGQIGAVGEYRIGRWSFNVRESIGVGGTMQYANISGYTTAGAPGIPTTTSPGGLLALSSNIGPHTRSMVSMIEEIGFNVGYQFTNHIRGFIGYNFLFWSSVARPAEQINPIVNPNLIPPVVPGGPTQPSFSFRGSDFWVQGLTFGIDIRW